jgi:heme oxygenase
MVTPILQALRTATRSLHDAVEATPCMLRLQAADVGEQDVARTFAVLLGAFTALEARLQGIHWYRPQAPALARDLQRLLPLAPVPVIARLPEAITAEGGELGIAYVLVGSRLGAKFIARHLADRLGRDWVEASAYYGSEVPFAAPQWSALMEALKAGEGEPHEVEGRRCAAAIASFRMLGELSAA